MLYESLVRDVLSGKNVKVHKLLGDKRKNL